MNFNLDEPITRVQVDGIVALKLIRHVREALPEIVSGQLLGLVVGDTLEVTQCFPIASTNPDDDLSDEEQQARSQEDTIAMMKLLRTVNVDANSVGWYTCGILASHLTPECIRSQYRYQTNTPRSVMLLFDPVATSRGILGLRALRLSQKFMKLYGKDSFTRESISEVGLSFDAIYEELPIEIVNTGLLRSLIWQLEESSSLQPSFASFDLSSNAFLEKNLTMLLDSVSDLSLEQSRSQAYQRAVGRQHALQQSLLAKRKAENTQRKHIGQAALPETLAALEAESPSAFKLPPEPSRLDALLATGQTNHYCEEIINFGGQDLTKLFLAKSSKTVTQ
jgi:translation initiation factor 3 subunit H